MNALARTLARLRIASEMEGDARDAALAELDAPDVEKHSGESERPHAGAPKAKEGGYMDTSWAKPDGYEFPRFAFEKQHGRDGEAGANKPKKHAEAGSGDDGGSYAAWACSLLNQILRAGGKDEAERAAEALSESLDAAGWAVAFDPRRGRYIAAPSEPAYDEFAERAPKGGTTINGKAYRGGMFIPSSAIKEAEQKAASGDEKAKAELATLKSGKAAESARLEKRGPVDREKLAAKLKHADAATASPLQGYHAKQAAASARALFAHHGDLALHRIDEIADAVRSAMDRTDDPDTRERLGQRLAGLAVALEHVGGVKGVTGERGAKPVEEAKPAPEAVTAAGAAEESGAARLMAPKSSLSS